MPPVPQWLTLDEAPGIRNAVWALVENPSVDVNTIHASEIIGRAGGEIERELLAALSDRYTDRTGLMNAFSTWWRKNRGSARNTLLEYFAAASARNGSVTNGSGNVNGENVDVIIPALPTAANAAAGYVNHQQQGAAVANHHLQNLFHGHGGRVDG